MGSKRGFGLIELVVALGILMIAILTAAFSIMNLQDMSELSKEKLVALTDANRVLEAMRNSANISTTNLQSTNWTTWATVNVMNTKTANETLLDQENITAIVGNGNPALVTLTVTWNHRQRPYTYQVVTLMTDRN